MSFGCGKLVALLRSGRCTSAGALSALTIYALQQKWIVDVGTKILLLKTLGRMDGPQRGTTQYHNLKRVRLTGMYVTTRR